jgi:uncharacterized protein YbjT (DUF2867 family)
MTHLITGATGNIGSLVVERLIARGARPRVFARDPEKARKRFGDKVDVAVGDLADEAALKAALGGIDALFLVNSGHDLDVRDALAAKAAKALGVRHLVKLSSYDATEQNIGTGVWHARGEAAIRASGITFTFVQPSGFMSNALYWARSIKADGVVRTATGDGKIPFIHGDDIADVATEALTTRKYDGVGLPITGPEALSYAEMTERIGAAIERKLTFQTMSDDEARKQQIAWNAPPELVEARISIFRAIREGRLATVTGTVENVLGRRALTFARWVEQNVSAFR